MTANSEVRGRIGPNLFIFLFIQYFKRVAHLAVQLFYLAVLCANIFTYIRGAIDKFAELLYY